MMKIAIPAQRNPLLVMAVLNRIGDSLQRRARDTGGCFKNVYFAGERLVAKTTNYRYAWSELYPQIYIPLTRQLIEPYRAWGVIGEDKVLLVQRRLRPSDDYTNTSRLPQFTRDEREACRLARISDVGGLHDAYHRNIGITSKGLPRILDFGCHEFMPAGYGSVTLEGGELLAGAEFTHGINTHLEHT